MDRIKKLYIKEQVNVHYFEDKARLRLFGHFRWSQSDCISRGCGGWNHLAGGLEEDQKDLWLM